MLIPANTAFTLLGFFVATKVGKTGLTDVTIDVYQVSTATKILADQACVEVGGGVYKYLCAAQAVPSGYVGVFKTADATVDAQHTPSLFIVGDQWVENANAAPIEIMG